MNRLNLLFFIFLVLSIPSYSQHRVQIYHPEANALADLQQAIQKAAKENKHVFVQIGGNWCPWCIKFHSFIHENAKVDSLLKADYIICLVNYSKENKNQEVLKLLEYPQRFGFPVFVILDKNGQRIHTQDSGLLESGEGYDEGKVIHFLRNWSPRAFAPSLYTL